VSVESQLATLITALGADYKALNGYRPPTYRAGRMVSGTVLTTFQTSHGWSAAGTGGTNGLNDTTDFITGSQSAWIQSNGAAAQYNLRRFGSAIGDTTGKAFRLRVKIDDLTKLDELVFYAGKGSLSADDYKWSFIVGGGSPYLVAGEWANVVLSFANATVEGTPLRTDCVDLQFQVYDTNTGTGAKLHAQSVELIPGGHADFPNGVVSICFDDTWASPKTYAYNKMDALGFPGTMFIIQEYLGTTNYLTLQDLKDRTDRFGWEIACHATTGANHASSQTGLTAAALDADLRTQRAVLEAYGFRGASGYALPLGQFGKTSDNASTIDITRKYMSYARTTHGRTTEVLPPADPYRLRAISAIGSFSGGVTAATLTTTTTGKIDMAKSEGAWLILVFHKIVTGSPADTGECSQTDFNAIMDKIASAGMPVMTIEDVLKTTSS
jgi:peptidoglycan/xylan/chitin deacetylase (PgdA/CDA1 family)